MSISRHRMRDGIVAVAAGGVLALAALLGVRAAVQSGGPRAIPAPGSASSPAAADACERSGAGGGSETQPEADPVPGPAFPRQQHELGTGRPVRVTGTANAEIAYHRLGEFATVVDFDCADCQGPLSILNTGSALPVARGETTGERVEVHWLIDTVHEMTPGAENSLLVRARGNWTLTLRSWHDLPIAEQQVNGRGSQVVRVATPRVRLSFSPLNSRDTLNAYAYRLSDRDFRASSCIGRFESQVLDLNQGEVLLVWARGEWTVEPM